MAENGLFRTPLFDPKIPSKKFMWVPFCALSQETRHIIFSGGLKSGVSGGGQRVYVEKVYVLFPSLCNYVLFSPSSGCQKFLRF